MNREDLVQIFQDEEEKRQINHMDEKENVSLNHLDDEQHDFSSFGNRQLIHNETSFATTSSFQNTKFDPMSSSDNIDHDHIDQSEPQNHSIMADFGFLPDSPLTTNRPHLQRAYTNHSIQLFANLPHPSKKSDSVNTLIRKVSRKSSISLKWWLFFGFLSIFFFLLPREAKRVTVKKVRFNCLSVK